MPQERDLKVSLGCGTLILIAIIVLFFNGNGSNRQLRDEMNQMKNAVTNLQNEIKSLRRTIENQQRENPPLPGK